MWTKWRSSACKPWLARERKADTSACLDAAARQTLTTLDQPGWNENPAKAEEVRAALLPAAAYYFLRAKNSKGRTVDPVARFHLGNGARLERLNFLGDISPKGIKQAHGLMIGSRRIERFWDTAVLALAFAFIVSLVAAPLWR